MNVIECDLLRLNVIECDLLRLNVIEYLLKLLNQHETRRREEEKRGRTEKTPRIEATGN